jgi:signal transduction histidine kinase/ligand-binding sensor domain-containing protein/ActR/RegA family two-component response regulator
MSCRNYLLYLLLLTLLSDQASAQFSRQMFGKLNIEGGLSQSVVQAIVQDKYGFMWFGTNDGLNKFDGYSFKVFRKNDGLSDGAIKCLLTVNDTLLWIGTRYSGIDILDLKTNKICKHINTANSNLNSNTISFMQNDPKGNVWVATDNGLNIIFPNYAITSVLKNPSNIREMINNIIMLGPHNIWFSKETTGVYNYRNGVLKRYPILNNKPLKYFDNIIMDRDSTIWLGSSDGLYHKRKQDTAFYQKVIENYPITRLQIHHIFTSRDGNIWFSIHTHGLFSLNPRTDEVVSYADRTQNANKFDLITTISSCIDRSGMIWIGTNGHGLQYFYPSSTFKTISFDLNSDFRTSSKSIRKIAKHPGNKNLLWISGYGGLDLFDKNRGLLKNYTTSKYSSRGLTCDAIYDVYHSETGNVLLGTEGKGLLVFDVKKEKFYTPSYADSSLAFALNYKVYKDSDNIVWLGTNRGLYRFDEKTNTIHGVYNPINRTHSFYISDISEIKDLILLATNRGLYIYDKRTKICKNTSLNLKLVSEPQINSIYIENNIIWFCTGGNGLLKYEYDLLNNTLLDLKLISSYNITNGMPNDVVYGIRKDQTRRYWMSTNNGLVCLDPENNSLNTYNFNDGLQGNEFNCNSFFKDDDGVLYFGGINGLSYFNPTTLYKNKQIPLIFFTSFKIFNNEADSDFNLNEISELEIPYSDNVLTFSFASADYLSNSRLNYAYKLEGFNNEFIQLGRVNNVTFTNLDPREYRLHVIGTNSDGVWNHTGRSLRIKVIPPFWKTVWFISYTVLVAVILIYVFIRLRLRTIAQINIRLENEVARRTIELSEKNKELAMARDAAEKSDKAKSEFLATMSHEIRTPMNGVVGMVSLLENAALTPIQKNYVDIIRTSTDNLLQVINDILDFSKIDSGRFDLFIESVNIHKLIETSIELFMPKAIEKNIELITYIHPSVPEMVLTDETRLKQVLFNLLNNALKFTPAGHVYVEVNCKDQHQKEITLEFKVSDTGIGIPEEKQAHIFHLFTQADSSTSRKFGGTGLGLTICKKLVELMGGEIFVKSAAGKGAEFAFHIKASQVGVPAKKTVKPLFRKAIINFDNHLTSKVCIDYLSDINVDAHEYDNNLGKLVNANESIVVLTDNLSFVRTLLTGNTNHIRIIYFYTKIGQEIKTAQPIAKPLTKNKIIKAVSENTPVLAIKHKTPVQVNLSEKYPLKILVAEDYSINQIILNKMFTSLGYQVKIVDNGKLALNEVQRNAYDLLFMDVHMPELDGVQATLQIIGQLKDKAPVIIALTASVINNEIHEYKNAGMQDVLAKPLAFDDLKVCITRWGERLCKN